MSRIELPSDPKARGRIVEAHVATEARKTEMGLLGGLYGGLAEKPGNIAGFAITIAFIGILVLLVAPDSATFPKREALTLFGGIITGALGFLFGRTTS